MSGDSAQRGDRTAAVVGGLGVIGSTVTEALRADGWDVAVVTNDEAHRRHAGWRYGDLLAPETLPGAVAGAKLVVQCATFPSYPNERPELGHTFDSYDGRGTAALVAAAERSGCRRYIYFSGGGVPAEQESAPPYFAAMRRGEQAVLGSGLLEGVCLRPTMVYGPRDRTLNQIIELGRHGRVPVIGSGRQRYQPIYVRDLGEISRQVARLGGPRGVFEIGGPERLPFTEMIELALARVGLRARVVRIPLWLARFAATVRPGRPLTRTAVEFAVRDDIADLRALRGAFDVRLTPFADGLADYLDDRSTSVAGEGR